MKKQIKRLFLIDCPVCKKDTLMVEWLTENSLYGGGGRKGYYCSLCGNNYYETQKQVWNKF